MTKQKAKYIIIHVEWLNMVLVKDPHEIESALFTYHRELALTIKDRVPLKIAKIVEIGSGPGTFTIPFINEMNNNFEKFYCVDPFYGNDLDQLKKRVHQHQLKEKIEILSKDAENCPIYYQ